MARFVLTRPVTMRELSTADVLTAMIAGPGFAPRQVGTARHSPRRAVLSLAASDRPHTMSRRATRVLALIPLEAVAAQG